MPYLCIPRLVECCDSRPLLAPKNYVLYIKVKGPVRHPLSRRNIARQIIFSANDDLESKKQYFEHYKNKQDPSGDPVNGQIRLRETA